MQEEHNLWWGRNTRTGILVKAQVLPPWSKLRKILTLLQTQTFLQFVATALETPLAYLSMTVNSAQREVRTETIFTVCCGTTLQACKELWPQPHPTPLGWIALLTVSHDLSHTSVGPQQWEWICAARFRKLVVMLFYFRGVETECQ